MKSIKHDWTSFDLTTFLKSNWAYWAFGILTPYVYPSRVSRSRCGCTGVMHLTVHYRRIIYKNFHTCNLGNFDLKQYFFKAARAGMGEIEKICDLNLGYYRNGFWS
jgi:hypothetical protein